jgi:hypothetical protein
MAGNKNGIPAWVWIGCGCLLFPALVVLVLGVAGFSAFNYGKSAIEKMADPEKRAAAAREDLGATALPAGWHVRTYFAFPFGFSLVVLGDGTPPPPPEGETFEDKARSLESLDLGNLGDNKRIFIYMTLDKDNDETIEQILNGGQRGGSGMNLDLGIRFEDPRELSRGDLQVAGQRVAFVGKEGLLEVNRGEDHRIVYSELSFECPDKGRRLGLIFELVPEQQNLEATDLATPRPVSGTVADGQVLQGFLDSFAVCNG